MNLTPRQIQEKQFHDSFRGYSHEEVDGFLDAVAQAFDHIFRENQSLQHRLKEIEVELTQAKGTEDMLKRMLVTAQETADKAVQEARTKGQSIEQRAADHAAAVVADAEKKAQEIVVTAVARERETQDAIEGAKRFDREYRTRLRAFIESQLRVLDEGPAPALVDLVGSGPPARTDPAKAPTPSHLPKAVAPVVEPSILTATPAPVVTPARVEPAPAGPPAPVATSAPLATPAPVAISAPVATPPPAVRVEPAAGESFAPAGPSAPVARKAVSEVMRRTEADRVRNGSESPSISSPDVASPPEVIVRLPQEVAALVPPGGEPEPQKKDERSIDDLFWGEE